MCTRLHASHIIFQVVEQNAQVDIGNHQVERAASLQTQSIAQFHIDAIQMVQVNVLARVVYAPFVHINSQTMLSPTHTG